MHMTVCAPWFLTLGSVLAEYFLRSQKEPCDLKKKRKDINIFPFTVNCYVIQQLESLQVPGNTSSTGSQPNVVLRSEIPETSFLLSLQNRNISVASFLIIFFFIRETSDHISV